jgi:hypothetical protein
VLEVVEEAEFLSPTGNRNEQARADPALYSQPSYPAVMLEMVDSVDGYPFHDVPFFPDTLV